MFISWIEIESFHNIRKFTKAQPEILNNYNIVTYSIINKLGTL